jgi:tetratricopeptide (TPR) repeat protein
VVASAFQSKDYDLARLAGERLVLLDEEEPAFRFQLALVEAARGNGPRTAGLMDSLTPLDRQGYAPAHLWVARALLAANPSPAALRAAEVHLRRTLQDQPNEAEAHGLLGRLYLATGRPEEAKAHLLRATDEFPEVELDLARLFTAQGNGELARIHAERAQRLFHSRVAANLDDHDARLNRAEAYLVLRDFPAAVGVLQEGWELTANARYRAALGRTYLLWSDEAARSGKSNLGEEFALLEKAMQNEGASPAVLDRLLAATQVKGPEAEKARNSLRSLLAQGKSPALVHLALGLDAQERGNLTEAQRHYEQANKLAPDTPVVLNNLAWSLAQAPSPDLPRALELVNAALANWPNQPRFRDTRGQILAKLGRWKEALGDLEAALPALPKSPDLHRALAETYEHLGMAEMAAEHRRFMERPAP